MNQERWTAVDNYVSEVFALSDPVVDAAIEAGVAAGLPQIQVSAPQGKLLHLLARSVGARSILEIGTLAGYSTIWLARALPANGRLVTLEFDQKHAEVARANLARAGFADRVEVKVGRAQDTLPRLAGDGGGSPFDFIFIDADKTGYPDYFGWALKLSHKGTMIVADNVVRSGEVANAASDDANVQAVRRYNQLVAAEPRVSATVMQTVGSKGYDGFTIALVN